MKDKDLRAMTRVLFPVASTVILTRVPYKRSATPEDLLAAAPPFKGRVLLEPDTRKAVQLALCEGRRGSGERIGDMYLGYMSPSAPFPRRPRARRHRRLALPHRRGQAAAAFS